MRVLVTGGAGFIGAPLAKRIVDLGHKVTVIDSLSRGVMSNLSGYFDRLTYIKHDMKKPITFFEYDVVFDLASRVYGITKLYDDQPSFIRENTLILLNTLECLKDKCRHYFYISSSCVYNYVGCPLPHKEEDARMIPKTGYDLSKRFGEEIVRIYSEKYGFKHTRVRPFNVYGPNESGEAPHVVTDFYRRIKEEKENPTNRFWMLGKGSQTRCFTFLPDFLDGLILLMRKGSEGAFNIGNDIETSIGGLLRVMFKTAGLPYSEYTIEHRKAIAEDVQRRRPDTTKIRRLGWKPSHTLYEGLGETWKEITRSSA